MKTFLILISVMFILSPRDSNTQVSQQWVKRYNSTGTANDYAKAITYDAAGNVYVTGSANNNYLTIKYSPEGDTLWKAVYAGPANDDDTPNSIFVDAGGNVYVTGASFGNSSENDYATIKYDASGTQLWVQRYNGTNNDNDEAVSVAVDGSGNVYAGGWSSTLNGSTDFVIVKYSSAGSQLWARSYNGPAGGNEFMSKMIIDAAGNIYAAGRSRGASNDDFLTLKYNSSGILLWSARLDGNGNGNDAAVSLTVDNMGSVIVTGYTFGNGTAKDYTTVKYNNAGVQQWIKNYNRISASEDIPVGIVSDQQGNVYITGYCTGLNTTSLDYMTVAYSSNGTQLWAKSFNSGLLGVDDKASSIDIDGSGNIYVTGSTISSGTDFDYGTVKYSPAGDVLWSIIYESALSVNDNAIMVKADNNGNVYVTGTSSGFSGIDYLTVKYSQPIGITPIGTEVPDGFSLGQNYPNPFNPITNIKIQMPNSGLVKLTVFDISGKEVAVLVNEELNAGTYNVDFDASHLASGTYFYRMEAIGFTDVKKMILVK